MVGHGSAIAVLDEDRHVVLDRDVIGKDVHVPVVTICAISLLLNVPPDRDQADEEGGDS